MLTNNRQTTPIVFLMIALFITSCMALPNENIGVVFEANLNEAQDIYRIADLKTQEVERLTFTPDDFESYLLVSNGGEDAYFAIYGPNLAWHTYKLDLMSLKTTLLNKPATELGSIHPLGWAIGKDQNYILVSIYEARVAIRISLDNESIEEIELPSQGKVRPVRCSYSFNQEFIACYLIDKWANPIVSSYVYAPETKEEIQFGDSDEYCFQPEWSPAEDKILLRCLSDDADASQIYLYEVVEGDTIHAQEIMNISYAKPSLRMRADTYAWSPDGKYFVATSCTINGITYPFVLFNADGSIKQYLSPRDMPEDMIITDITWSPDSQSILYIAGQDEELLNIYIMNADGSESQVLTMEPSNYSNLWVYSKP